MIRKILNLELQSQLFSSKNLENFGKKITKHSEKLYNFLKKLKSNGKKISIYGASGKGQALMQYCKIDSRLIDFVFDKSKLKQNRFTPGTNIKIFDPKHISKKKVDYLLVLSWNIIKEIMTQENSFIKKGGKFIVPFPEPKIFSN